MEEQTAKQATLQTCLDQMGMLLLDHYLRNASENCDVSRMSQAKTWWCLDQSKRLRSVRLSGLPSSCTIPLVWRTDCYGLQDPLEISPTQARVEITHAGLVRPLRVGFIPFTYEFFAFWYLYMSWDSRRYRFRGWFGQ
jgi:hypothetical protein